MATRTKKPASKVTAKKARAPARVLNARPDTLDFRDLMYTPTLIEVPTQVPLEDFWKYQVPVLDQGAEGACTGFGLATVAALVGGAAVGFAAATTQVTTRTGGGGFGRAARCAALAAGGGRLAANREGATEVDVAGAGSVAAGTPGRARVLTWEIGLRVQAARDSHGPKTDPPSATQGSRHGS